MSQKKIVITGTTGDIATRLEIYEFIKDKRQLSLYIQALSAMYSEAADPRVSWFSVSGIHGKPYVSWDQAPAPVNPDGQPGPYCTHAVNIFPPWHRPYVALLEQVLHNHAVKIAKSYTVDQNHWNSTAAKLRQPYWDWASNPVPPDVVISQQKIKILIPPNGQEVEVDNPFFQYRFRGKETDSFVEPFKTWQYTLRYPTGDNNNPHSDPQALKNALIQLSKSDDPIKYRTFKMFLIHDWDHFSTTAAASPTDHTKHTNSLEGIHNTLHIVVGGNNGHMSVIDVAAFDPIFFLHHCQVDRLLSLWYYIHRVWVPTTELNQDLVPFWNSQSTYWEAKQTIEASAFNYTYPELVGNPSPSDVARIVDNLYGGGTFEPGPVIPSIGTLSAQPPQAQPSQEHKSIIEWTARVRTKQFELGGSFSVLIFLGNVPENHKEWYASPSFVGTFDAFVNGSPETCPNCQTHPDVEIMGFVHLNKAILNRQDDQASLHEDYVVPRLKKHLAWRVLKVDGTVASLQELASLEVVVIATPLTLPPGAILPIADNPTHHHHITRGVPGGSRTVA